VDLTPPGDVKPAFKKEMDLIRKLVDETYGNGLGLLLFPDNRIVLLNKIGGLDFTAEIIMDGKIYGLFLYDPIKQSFRFKPKSPSAGKIVQITKNGSIKLKKFIEISDDVVQFITTGKSILAPGV
jgi:phosphoadenosine phosphosulfate reductase